MKVTEGENRMHKLNISEKVGAAIVWPNEVFLPNSN